MNDLWSLSIGAILATGGTLLGYFFRGYFAELGKNIVLKNNIAELTNKVEGIKNEFVKENIQLKHNLDILSKKQTELLSDERAALLGFYDSIYSMLTCFMYSDIYLDDEKYQEFFKEKYIGVERSVYQLEISYGRLKLFIDNKEIIDKATSIKEKLRDFSEDLIASLLAQETAYIKEESHFEALENGKQSKYNLDEINKERLKIESEYISQSVEFEKVIMPEIDQIGKMIKNYLLKF